MINANELARGREPTGVHEPRASGATWSELREDAARRARVFERPKASEERWRYTDAGEFFAERYRVSSVLGARPAGREALDASAALSQAGPGSSASGLCADGVVSTLTVAPALRSTGFILADCLDAADAVDERGRTARGRLAGLARAEDRLSAESLALASGGFFVFVPAETEVVAPVVLLHRLESAGIAAYERNVIVVEPGAALTLLDIYQSANLGAASLAAPTTEVYVGAGARLGLFTWCDWSGPARGLSRVVVRLAEDAQAEIVTAATGGKLSRLHTEVLLDGAGARAQLLGAYTASGDDRVEHWTVQDHRAPRTVSNLSYRGSVAGRGQSLFYGTIFVRENAAGADAYQVNRNILLSEAARADSNPQLEIENNDVRCTHGATVGPLDPEQLFYLQSRGIPAEAARQLLLEGFFASVLRPVAWLNCEPELTSRLAATQDAPRATPEPLAADPSPHERTQ